VCTSMKVPGPERQEVHWRLPDQSDAPTAVLAFWRMTKAVEDAADSGIRL